MIQVQLPIPACWLHGVSSEEDTGLPVFARIDLIIVQNSTVTFNVSQYLDLHLGAYVISSRDSEIEKQISVEDSSPPIVHVTRRGVHYIANVGLG